jgi:Ran GTPase-activating protein (RanGAP) involved in mRNA processing and transport
VLNLSLNNFDKKSVQMISQGLISKKSMQSNAGIDTLIMDACLFRPSLLEALAVGVKNTASLKTLSLRNNRINHQGASWIGVMLRDYVSLGHYSGSTESISSTSSIQHGLERLALDGNDLRQGIQFVAQALKRNQSLKELGLSGCKIDARSVVYLGDALVSCDTRKINTSDPT